MAAQGMAATRGRQRCRLAAQRGRQRCGMTATRGRQRQRCGLAAQRGAAAQARLDREAEAVIAGRVELLPVHAAQRRACTGKAAGTKLSQTPRPGTIQLLQSPEQACGNEENRRVHGDARSCACGADRSPQQQRVLWRRDRVAGRSGHGSVYNRGGPLSRLWVSGVPKDSGSALASCGM